MVLNRAKDYYENDKERLRERQEINTETCLNKEKQKKENIEKIDISICLKKRKKRLKEYPKNSRGPKTVSI